MTLKTTLVALASLMVMGCGEYVLEDGDYALKDAQLASGTSTDTCGILDLFKDPARRVGITASGDTVTFDFTRATPVDPDTLSTATLSANLLSPQTEANFAATFPDQNNVVRCVARIHRSVEGEVTADNTATLSLTVSADTETGTTCDIDYSLFAVHPCTTTYQFVATKTP